jgi:hypothetical protein
MSKNAKSRVLLAPIVLALAVEIEAQVIPDLSQDDLSVRESIKRLCKLAFSIILCILVN